MNKLFRIAIMVLSFSLLCFGSYLTFLRFSEGDISRAIFDLVFVLVNVGVIFVNVRALA